MHVKTLKFEGPLDLLLRLIEKEELDITEVSLAKIADQYIELIKSAEIIHPEKMADFLYVAAKLLYIKSKALLPYLVDEEEDAEIDELERQLRMYKEFLEATEKVEKLIGKKKFLFAREFNREFAMTNAKSFFAPKNISSEVLRDVFSELLIRLKPMDENLEKGTIEDSISIDEKILNLEKEIIVRLEMSFQEFLKVAKNRTEVIVSFLAMLELSKQRIVSLDQDEMFADIMIRKFQ